MEYLAEGTCYLLPPESQRKRELEAALAGLLSSAGYQEVVLPVVQAYDPDAPRPLRKMMDIAYKFIDYRGQVMVLRPDMTEVVANLASRELRDLPRPLRLFYSGSIFRARRPGRAGVLESYQMGAELVGMPEPEADVEILSMTAECLKAAGISEFQIRLGHAGIMEAVMDFAGMEEKKKAELRAALTSRDLVRLGHLIESLDIPADCRKFLEKILELPDGRDILDTTGKLAAYDRSQRMGQALSELEEVIAGATSGGIGGFIQLDLGLMRDLEYYTGIVFEVYTPGCGRPISGGGRYDGLLKILGRPEGAVGFALDMEEVLNAGQR
ncbi:MAG TPA: ATP phosphoribosyltransferase regulatory subunit [Firmicutes bacterium]|nr:ATP phosphoribosyltransferase regulatory subunit [Bacillota bacterium]